jgi:hypothetical protein
MAEDVAIYLVEPSELIGAVGADYSKRTKNIRHAFGNI